VVVAILLGALTVALGAAPAFASPRESTGDRINLFAGDEEYPADTPFFVAHGNAAFIGEDTASGRARFVLEVDGEIVPATYETHGQADRTVLHVWVFNFPDGMTGVHTFTGHWLAPCGAPTAYLACGESRPTTPVEYESHTVMVTFTAP
jgi:hypothetical protein